MSRLARRPNDEWDLRPLGESLAGYWWGLRFAFYGASFILGVAVWAGMGNPLFLGWALLQLVFILLDVNVILRQQRRTLRELARAR